MRICFLGTVEFSARIFRHLLDRKQDVAGLITSDNCGINSDYADLSSIAEKHGVPVLKTSDVNAEATLEWVRGLNADVIFCFGWSRLLKADILSATPLGVIGYHPAELPMNRGRHPLIWALALGLGHTASSLFFMDEGADSGDLLSQAVIPIQYEDDARTLYNKVVEAAKKQVDEVVPYLASGLFPRLKQDHSLTNYWRKRGMPDGCIDFRMPARGVYNLVRALTHPYVGAHLVYQGQAVNIWNVHEIPDSSPHFEPGKVWFADDNVIRVKCGVDSVEISKGFFDKAPDCGEYL